MTDVTNVAAKLDADKTLIKRVLSPKAGGFDLPVVGSTEIETLLDDAAIFNDEVYPVMLPNEAAFPNCVFTLTGIDTFDIEGYRITQTDSYTLTVRHQASATSSRYAEFDTTMRAVIAALRTSAYSLEPVDIRLGFNEDMQCIQGEIDIELTYLAQPDGSTPGNNATDLPAALVIPLGRSAAPGETHPLKQLATDQYGIVIITADANIPALMAEVRGSIHGYGQTTGHFDMQYVSGQNMGGVSNMEVWLERYEDAITITET